MLGRVVKFRHTLWRKLAELRHRSKIRDLAASAGPRRLNVVKGRSEQPRPRMAVVLDDFSYESLKYDADLLQLSTKTYAEDMERFQPDFVFIESAWNGVGNEWRRKVSVVSSELLGVISWARGRGVPTVFWHKEVPPHIDTFLTVSTLFDWVFLTDADCVALYKKLIHSDRVYALPFGCQPRLTHPIVSGERQMACMFAGTYYPKYRYPERNRDFTALFSVVRKFLPVVIFDRSNGRGRYRFPSSYKNYLNPALPFREVVKKYREYEFALNLNSVKGSSTMCARRVFELIASNTFVISNAASAIETLFGRYVIANDNALELEKRLMEVVENPDRRNKMKICALRLVLRHHTYSNRIAEVLSQLSGREINHEAKKVAVVAWCTRDSDVCWTLDNVMRQLLKPRYVVLFVPEDRVPTLAHIGRDKLPSEVQLVMCGVSRNWGQTTALLNECDYIAVFGASDYYGKHYLRDLVDATLFGVSDAVTKASYFRCTDGKIHRPNSGLMYRQVKQVVPKRGIIPARYFDRAMITDPGDAIAIDAISIHEYDYCEGISATLDMNSVTAQSILSDLF